MSAQSQVQYEISFPRSLQNDNLAKAKSQIFDDLQNIIDRNKINSKFNSIECLVNTSDEYFFLSQLQLLKIIYIEYGIFWFKKKQPNR